MSSILLSSSSCVVLIIDAVLFVVLHCSSFVITCSRIKAVLTPCIMFVVCELWTDDYLTACGRAYWTEGPWVGPSWAHWWSADCGVWTGLLDGRSLGCSFVGSRVIEQLTACGRTYWTDGPWVGPSWVHWWAAGRPIYVIPHGGKRALSRSGRNPGRPQWCPRATIPAGLPINNGVRC